ncbi:MXAN_6640 family putative metalloprotease [Nocardioides sp. C4-1]|uniref:MXAN_6640 family putative metalloprotease n=1 Tax=Nocardioides sp. C4-1 TaxID=3151851 RepID=UPI0032669480
MSSLPRPRPRLLAAAAVLAGALLLPAVPATSGASAVASAVASSADAEPQIDAPPLLRATEALRGRPGDLDRPEATLALRDLFLARPGLGDDGDSLAESLLARPTHRARDPYGDGYTVPSTKTCSRHFCVHHVTSTTDAPARPSWPATTLAVLEDVWRHHVERLGYRPPAPDGRRGGDARFDVYLKDVGSRGVYGYCAPERRVTGKPKQASGFCVLDNDFARSQYGRAPRQSLRVTAAHEFFHAVQFAYDFAEDPWLLESTATWMEERYADDVDDNRAYLRFGQLARPRVPLDRFEPTGYAHYGNWPFWEYLGQRFGTDVVRQVWRRAGTGGLPDDDSAQALRHVLAKRGGLPRVFADYASGNTVPARTYPEGSVYPAAPVAVRRLGGAQRRTTVVSRLDHLTSRSVRLVPDASLRPGTRLTITVKGPVARRSPAVALLVVGADGTATRRPIALNRNGWGRAVLRLDPGSVASATVTLANASTRYRCDRGTTFACRGTPVDQRQRFELKAFVR